MGGKKRAHPSIRQAVYHTAKVVTSIAASLTTHAEALPSGEIALDSRGRLKVAW